MSKRRRNPHKSLTPLRAVDHLRKLDEYAHEIPRGTNAFFAVDRLRDALAEHVRYGIERRKR